MFGDKDRLIAELQGRVNELEGDLGQLRPFEGPAREMAETYADLAVQASQDPLSLPKDLYEEAVNRVTAQRRAAVVARAAGVIAARRGAEIETEVLQKEGPDIERAETERFERAEAPGLRDAARRQAKQKIAKDTISRLRVEVPEQAERNFREAHEAEIVAAETERFMKQDAPKLARDAELRAKSSITDETRNKLRQQISEEAQLAAIKAAEDEERFRLRTNTIAENARRTHQIPVANLMPDDVITVDLCTAGETFKSPSAGSATPPKWTRRLRLSVISPEHGIVLVMDDNWEQGSPLARERSFASGTILVVGNPVELTLGDGKGPKVSAPRAIRRSVPLGVIHNETDKTIPGYEVDRVQIDTAKGQKLLLGEPEPQPQTSRRY